MSLTIDYAKLARKAAGNKGLSKASRHKKAKKIRTRSTDLTKELSVALVVPPETKRYFLRVPPHSHQTALAAGCVFDHHSHHWYIDNPTNLSDFIAWKPSRVGLDKLIKQLKQK